MELKGSFVHLQRHVSSSQQALDSRVLHKLDTRTRVNHPRPHIYHTRVDIQRLAQISQSTGHDGLRAQHSSQFLGGGRIDQIRHIQSMLLHDLLKLTPFHKLNAFVPMQCSDKLIRDKPSELASCTPRAGQFHHSHPDLLSLRHPGRQLFCKSVNTALEIALDPLLLKRRGTSGKTHQEKAHADIL